MVDNKNVSLLNIFVMDFALPATLFSATVQTPWTGILAQSPLILVLTLAMWITYVAIYFLATTVFKKSPQDAAVLTLTVALPKSQQHDDKNRCKGMNNHVSHKSPVI